MNKKLLYQKKLVRGEFLTFLQSDLLPSFPPCLSTHQIHSNLIFEVPLQKFSQISPQIINADGMIVIFNDNNHDQQYEFPTLLIKTADCLPICLIGERGYAFIHAGWRGLYSGILKNKSINQIKPYFAFIGPSIYPCCFEVGQEFKGYFPQSPFFEYSDHQKIFFSLQAEAKRQLKGSFTAIKIEESHLCTCCSTSLSHPFYSYRKNKTPLRNYHFLKFEKEDWD